MGVRRALPVALGLIVAGCSAQLGGPPLLPNPVPAVAPGAVGLPAPALPAPALPAPALPAPALPGLDPVAATDDLPDPTRETGLPQAAPAPGRDRLRPLVRIPTTRRVAFLTIDDGYIRTPSVLAAVIDAGVPLTIFPTAGSVAQEPAFFAALLAAGASLGDHTVTHPVLPQLSATRQVREVCAAAALERRLLHRAPVLFRPPYGATNPAVARAARHCGMRYELLWDATVNDGVVRNERGVVTSANPLEPGDIVLMHFRTTFAEDFAAALRAVGRSGLALAPITAYLPAGASDPEGITNQDDSLAGWATAGHTPLLGTRPESPSPSPSP